MWRALILAVLLPVPALAEPLTIEQFEAYATGKTLTYSVGGEVYGAEQYLPGRQVLWAFKGQECQKGTYYEEAGQVCFVYQSGEAPQCWVFTQDASGLRAKYAGDPEGAELSEVSQTPDPLLCAGPDVGA